MNFLPMPDKALPTFGSTQGQSSKSLVWKTRDSHEALPAQPYFIISPLPRPKVHRLTDSDRQKCTAFQRSESRLRHGRQTRGSATPFTDAARRGLRQCSRAGGPFLEPSRGRVPGLSPVELGGNLNYSIKGGILTEVKISPIHSGFTPWC